MCWFFYFLTNHGANTIYSWRLFGSKTKLLELLFDGGGVRNVNFPSRFWRKLLSSSPRMAGSGGLCTEDLHSLVRLMSKNAFRVKESSTMVRSNEPTSFVRSFCKPLAE